MLRCVLLYRDSLLSSIFSLCRATPVQPTVCTEHSEVCRQVNNFVVCGRYNLSDAEITCGTESDRTLCCWAVALAEDCCTDVAAMKNEITEIEFSFIFHPR